MTEIDLSAELQKRFSGKKIPVKWGLPIPYVEIGQNLFGSIVGLVFSNVRTIPVSTTYSDIKSGAVPDSVIRKDYTRANCRDSEYPLSETITIQYTEGSTVSRTTTVKIDNSVTSTAGIKLPILNISMGINDVKLVSFTQQDQESQSFTSIKTEVSKIEYKIPAKKVYIGKFEKRLTTDFMEFKGSVKIDGDVFIIATNINTGQVSKQLPAGSISDYLSDAESTIFLEGQIWNVKGENIVQVDREEPAANRPDLCEPIIKEQAISPNDPSQFLAALHDALSMTGLYDGGVQVVEPLVDGMVISTSNSVGNVEVRAQSLGPGFCHVDVSASGGSLSLLPAPFIWSDWSVLYSHIGRSDERISISVNCDTGAIFEVRYYRS